MVEGSSFLCNSFLNAALNKVLKLAYTQQSYCKHKSVTLVMAVSSVFIAFTARRDATTTHVNNDNKNNNNNSV